MQNITEYSVLVQPVYTILLLYRIYH